MDSRPCALVALLALLAGCSPTNAPSSTGDDAGGAPVGAPCTLSSDCVVAALCGYAIDAGCSAQGVCVPEYPACTNDGPVVCACDGTPVELACIYGPGIAPAPVPGTTPGCGPGDGGGSSDGGSTSDSGDAADGVPAD